MSKKKTPADYKDNLTKRNEDAKIVRRIASVIIISLLLIFIVGGISGFLYIKSALQPANPDSKEDVTIEIPLGSSTSEIARVLEENGIIKDSTIFRFYIKFKNESDFQAGEYTLSPSMEIDELIQALQKGKVLEEPEYTVTIPEGKTIKEMASIYAAALPFKEKAFLNQVNDPQYIETLINTYPDILSNSILNPEIRTPLEGYLFAATYHFYSKQPSVEKVINKMLEKTVEVVTPYLDEIASQDLTVHEALTMASLVENEASSQKQRKKIAGVFFNRLEEGMPLQTDPTVLYALGKHKKKVLLKDLEVESPYNTYHVNTLPVGPISNFAKTSLQATINPEESAYKYFLHDDKGNIHYAETVEKHRQLKAKYID
ncbi:endolytic transglycosylase MltG [Lentibacillus cibarius]|uniref:Endolytic murein transglycosylase n=1 Tax=Lentibacillus cibarius TaxID=2583219 RepID=A0A549YA39_9BACI|nr:endolytic transglycosylase MltG [Lentibacillus cibarius]TRM08756.1 endolytic transglycosylase MltG [Lentibacillus cibarius]TRM12786.1 endolytic transglycosylase MltG [Lentibacillus cibarius]